MKVPPLALLALALACAARGGGKAPSPAPVRAVLFDLGDTLVTGPRHWVPGVPEALRGLAATGVALGVISNTGKLSRDELVAKYLPADFSFGAFDPGLVLLSSELGVEKPDPRVFAPIAAAGLPGHLIAYLDENPDMVRAARKAGLLGLQVRIERGPDGSVMRSDVAGWIARLGGGPPSAGR